jgi:ribosomal protein S18 acetylase RimI-like enzyme
MDPWPTDRCGRAGMGELVGLDAPATLLRAGDIVALYDRVFTAPPWNDDPAQTDAFAARLPGDVRRPGYAGAAAFEPDGTLVGFAYAHITDDPLPDQGIFARVRAMVADGALPSLAGTVHVRELAVDPGHRRRALGRRLLERVVAGRDAWLLTGAEVPEAVGFYDRLGWRRAASVGSLVLYRSAG